jgi:arylsulfatase A-like enzyme
MGVDLRESCDPVKGDVDEGGIRIPFIVQWKGGLPAGRTFEAPVSALDILPTALAAAGAPPLPSTPVEGVNLLPHLRGEAQAPPHETLFWRWQSSKAGRQGDRKWVVANGRAPEELFDLASDPAGVNVARRRPWCDMKRATIGSTLVTSVSSKNSRPSMISS